MDAYLRRVLVSRGKQMRPVYTAKEACIHSKRGLYTQQKRPVYTAKEACIHSKRGRQTWRHVLVSQHAFRHRV